MATTPCQSTSGHDDQSFIAIYVNYWKYKTLKALACSGCGWSGGSPDEDHLDDGIIARCPGCARTLALVAWPTTAETRAAAADGDSEAADALARSERADERLRRAKALELRSPEQLPNLPAATIRLEWDCCDRAGDKWTILRADGTEIWRELAYFEGIERFADVVEILRLRYGRRLCEVRPTPESELYLYGDRLSAPRQVDEINSQLAEDRHAG